MFTVIDVNPHAIRKLIANDALWVGVVCFGEN